MIFPTYNGYNMNKMPLLFENCQDDTFAMDNDNDVNIKWTKELLRKQQFNIHIVFNMGTGKNVYGWYDIV